jgi:hypothetical protein
MTHVFIAAQASKGARAKFISDDDRFRARCFSPFHHGMMRCRKTSSTALRLFFFSSPEQLLYGSFSHPHSALLFMIKLPIPSTLHEKKMFLFFLLDSCGFLYFLLWEFPQIPLCEIKLLALVMFFHLNPPPTFSLRSKALLPLFHASSRKGRRKNPHFVDHKLC